MTGLLTQTNQDAIAYVLGKSRMSDETRQNIQQLADAALEKTQQATYDAALQLVEEIDTNLSRGIYHYRDTQGQLLDTLDQVVVAILEDRWPAPDQLN